MGIVGSLFTYLVNVGYLAGNPWTPRRRKRAPRVRRVERYLDQAQWKTVLDFLQTLPQVPSGSSNTTSVLGGWCAFSMTRGCECRVYLVIFQLPAIMAAGPRATRRTRSVWERMPVFRNTDLS